MRSACYNPIRQNLLAQVLGSIRQLVNLNSQFDLLRQYWIAPDLGVGVSDAIARAAVIGHGPIIPSSCFNKCALS